MLHTSQEHPKDNSSLKKHKDRVLSLFRREERHSVLADLRQTALAQYFQAILTESKNLKSHFQFIMEAEGTREHHIFRSALRDTIVEAPYGVMSLGGIHCNQPLMVALAIKVLP